LQEVIVTANRRTENLQNVPITIQALTGETLTQLNATTFDDYVKFLPNVTAATNGPVRARSTCAALRPPRTVSSRPAPPAASRTSRSILMSSRAAAGP